MFAFLSVFPLLGRCRPLTHSLALAPTPSRLVLLGSSFSARPSRLVLLGSSFSAWPRRTVAKTVLHPFLLMSLAFLTLGLLCARSAQAQGDVPCSSQTQSHCWQITYARTDTSAGYHWMQSQNPGAPVYYSAGSWASNGGGAGGQYACDAAASGTVTATLTWVPATGQTLQADPPSEPVYIAEQGYADYQNGTVTIQVVSAG